MHAGRLEFLDPANGETGQSRCIMRRDACIPEFSISASIEIKALTTIVKRRIIELALAHSCRSPRRTNCSEACWLSALTFRLWPVASQPMWTRSRRVPHPRNWRRAPDAVQARHQSEDCEGARPSRTPRQLPGSVGATPSSYQCQHARVCVEAIVRDLAIAEEPHNRNVAKRLLDRLELMGFVPE